MLWIRTNWFVASGAGNMREASGLQRSFESEHTTGCGSQDYKYTRRTITGTIIKVPRKTSCIVKWVQDALKTCGDVLQVSFYHLDKQQMIGLKRLLHRANVSNNGENTLPFWAYPQTKEDCNSICKLQRVSSRISSLCIITESYDACQSQARRYLNWRARGTHQITETSFLHQEYTVQNATDEKSSFSIKRNLHSFCQRGQNFRPFFT